MTFSMHAVLWLCLVALLSVCSVTGVSAAGERASAANGGPPQLYIGTYTRGKNQSKGIYQYQFDPASGAMRSAGVTENDDNPSFLALHPNKRFLYAVAEIGDFGGQKSGAVVAYAVQPGTGALSELNRQATGGSSPCHLVVDPTGKFVLAANYGGGSACVIAIDENGRLGARTGFVQHHGSSINPRRQAGPHAHSVNLDAAGKHAFVADLGLDKVFIYSLNTDSGTLTPGPQPWVSIAPGAGPRHFAFHPDGRCAYVINELDSTVTAFCYDAEAGRLEMLQTLPTLPEGFQGTSTTAEVQVHPTGEFLYGSNRGHDSIAIFAIDERTGTLTPLGHEPTGGKQPRHFAIDPTGKYLLAANQAGDNIVVFAIDAQTGKLTPTGTVVEVPSPVCVRFLPMDG